MPPRLIELDHALFERINSHAGGLSDYLFGWPTHLIASPELFTLLFVLLWIWSPKKLFWNRFFAVSFAALCAGAASHAVKTLVDRARPVEAFYGSAVETLYGVYVAHSFPSAHAALALGTAAGLARYYPKESPFFFAFAFALSLTRVYVGAHFPSDVFAGALLGAVTGALAVRFHEKAFPPRAGARG